MSYNRWMPPECSTELYHHGVKGMKWGKHLFGNGADIQAGAGVHVHGPGLNGGRKR